MHIARRLRGNPQAERAIVQRDGEHPLLTCNGHDWTDPCVTLFNHFVGKC